MSSAPGTMARTTQRQAAAAENDSSDDERQQAPSTSYKNLSPQDYNQREEPLSEASVTRLNNLKLDWKRHSEDMIELVNTLAEAAEELAEAFADEPDSEEWNKHMQDIDRRVKALLDSAQRARAYENALNTVKQQIHRDENVTDAPGDVDRLTEEGYMRWSSQTQRKKYSQGLPGEAYKAFREKIWSVFNPEKGMPPVSTLLQKDEDDESGSDEDVEMGSSTLNPKCPILLTVMTNPYTCSACRHSFSKEGLDDYLRSGPRQCPASGCNTIIRKELCQPDKTLQKRIQRLVEYQRRQEAKEQAEEESESGDDSDE